MYSCCSLGGVAMVSLSDLTLEDSIPTGALWSLASAMLYAFYLVMVRRRVGHEERMDIPMFFGEWYTVCLLFPPPPSHPPTEPFYEFHFRWVSVFSAFLVFFQGLGERSCWSVALYSFCVGWRGVCVQGDTVAIIKYWQNPYEITSFNIKSSIAASFWERLNLSVSLPTG